MNAASSRLVEIRMKPALFIADCYHCKLGIPLLSYHPIHTMKKILSVFCCVLYMHSISNATPDMKAIPKRISGEKVLVKALAAIVNREGKKKTPLRRVNLSLSESV
jgi:hypothetical protein